MMKLCYALHKVIFFINWLQEKEHKSDKDEKPKEKEKSQKELKKEKKDKKREASTERGAKEKLKLKNNKKLIATKHPDVKLCMYSISPSSSK